MNCKYLKQKLNHKLECKLKNKIITFKDCNNCKYKEYKCTINQKNCANCQNKIIKNTTTDKKMKSKSNKLAKLEKNRTSILTDDLEHCIVCGKKKVHLHEIFSGRNRTNSIIYKLVIPLCYDDHVGVKGIHNNSKLDLYYKKLAQKKFNEVYPDLNFIEIFKKNWL